MNRRTETVDSPGVKAAVEEWVNHKMPGEPPFLTENRDAYVKHHLDRCVRALNLIPVLERRGRLLELGSGLYFMTFLMRRICDYDLDLVQYWERPNGRYETVLEDRKTGARLILPFEHFNAEQNSFPYPDSAFDVVVVCEIIEHLYGNPVHMLAECHRILRPGGTVVVTTPNVLRWFNVSKLIAGKNIYDKYTQESPGARHPREYTPEELRALFEGMGYRVVQIETHDATGQRELGPREAIARLAVWFSGIVDRLYGRKPLGSSEWRGGHILLAAVKSGSLNRSYPDFLFERPELVGPIIEALCRPTSSPGKSEPQGVQA